MGTLKRAVVVAGLAIAYSLGALAKAIPSAHKQDFGNNGYDAPWRNRKPTHRPNKKQIREHNRKSNKAARKARAKHRSK